MTFELFLMILIIGLNLACFYLLIALGLTLMFGICGIVNMAHGVFYMASAFGLFYFCTDAGLNFFVSLIIVMSALGLAGLLMEKFIFRPTGWDFAPTIVTTIGFLILFEGIGYLVTGPRPRGMAAPITGSVAVFSLNISYYRLVVFPVTVLITGALYYLIQRTNLGLAMRATEEDKIATALMGINPNRVNSLVFFISFVLVAVAGSLMAPVYALSPSMGTLPLLKAFMVIILGGMGSVPGAIVGSIVVGLLDAFLSVTVGTELSYIIAWLIVITILIFRPKGLFGAY